MSGSENDEELGLPPPNKRRRKHVFQNKAQRVAAVDVDVYRQLSTVRQTPLPTATSFTQEELQKWRELNTAEDFIKVAAALHNFTQSYPLLLHHKDEVMAILLHSIRMDANLSLEPLLVLLGTLARDLQADFLPFLPRVLASLCNLVDAGAHAQPEVLEHVFSCIALICKHLVKPLSADLPHVCRHTARLRFHWVAHVRRLAATTLSFLFRHATSGMLRTGVRTVLAEVAVKPSEARVDGAGQLLAETARGTSHGLHSRAPVLLALLFQQDLLTSADLKGSQKAGAINQRALREQAARVTRVAVEHLLVHLRRGKAGDLWDTALAEADRRISRLETTSVSDPGLGDAISSAAQVVASVAQLTEFYRGSRVEDYEPLFSLARRLCAPEVLRLVVGAMHGPEAAGAGHEAEDEPSITGETLRLLTAIMAGHRQQVGASGGAPAIRRNAAAWAPVFDLAPVQQLAPFLRSLMTPPTGGEAMAQIFAADALLALARMLLPGGAADDEGRTADLALPLLADLCHILQPQGLPKSTPLLHTAKQQGALLAAHVQDLVKSWPSAVPDTARGVPPQRSCALAHAALHCLPYACVGSERLAALLDGLISRTAAALGGKESSLHAAILLLHVESLRKKAALLTQLPTEDAKRQLKDLAEPALSLVKEFPGEFAVMRACAVVLDAAKAAGKDLPLSLLKEILEVVAANLSSPSQPLRRETLRVLLAFDQPPQPTTEEGQGPLSPSDILAHLETIESSPCSISSGRAAAIAIGNMKSALEFDRVPEELLRPLVCSLLGTLNIRFSLIWQPSSEALAMALRKRPAVAWPLVLRQLEAVQAAFLSGQGRGVQPEEDVKEQLRTAAERFAAALNSGGAAAGGGFTDASVQLGWILKAVAEIPSELLEKSAREWVPIFLDFVRAKQSPDVAAHAEGVDDAAEANGNSADAAGALTQDAEGDENVLSTSGRSHEAVLSNVSGRAWRAQLKEWLSVVGCVKGLKNIYCARQVRLAVALQLSDSDAAIQQAAINCLKALKLKYLNEHVERLVRLAADSTLREELSGFPLAKGSENNISEQHRPGMVAVVVRLLWPKMRKRSGRLGGKGAPGSARAAILNFLAAAEPLELASLMLLVLQPLSSAFRKPDNLSGEDQLDTADRLFDEPWWTAHLGRKGAAWWLSVVDVQALGALPLRVRLGFLNAAVDLLQHLGHRLTPFLPEICTLLISLLESAPVTAAPEDGEAAKVEGAREVRSSTLRLLADIWARFPAGADYSPLWPRFFTIVQPIAQRLPIEASADRAPPLLEVVAAFASSPNLVPLLADRGSTAKASAELPDLSTPSTAEWASQQHYGSRLMGQVALTLLAPSCADPARDVVLGVIESLLDLGDEVAAPVLNPHMGPLLEALRTVVVASNEQPGKGGRQKWDRKVAKGKSGGGSGKKSMGMRALSVVERLSSFSYSAETAGKLVDALLPMLLQKAGSRKSQGNDVMMIRALRVLAAVWKQQAQHRANEGSQADAKLLACAEELAPLAGSLEGREAGLALSAALESLSQLQPGLVTAARLLTGLAAVSSTEIDEVDYDARLGAYKELQAPVWVELMTSGGAAMLLQRCFQDLRNSTDLSLRHASAQALDKFLEAAAAEVRAVQGKDSTAARLVQKLVFARAKRMLAAGNLAVRQEHLSILRTLALRFPAHFPDLGALAEADVEVDFFANVAHLQMHRRTRALQGLSKVMQEGSLGPGTLLGIGMPLLSQMITEGKAGEDGGHEMKQVDRDREANTVDVAIRVLGDMARHLAWPHYQQLLGRFLRDMQHQSEGNKAVIRAVCTIIDGFHFRVAGEDGLAPIPAPEDTPGSDNESAEEVAEDATEAVGNADAKAEAAEIQQALVKRVLPVLQAQLVLKAGEVVRPPVALALVKLLRLLPQSAARAALPRALQGVANLLRNRLQRIRDDARNVLAAMVAELGPVYLPFVLDVLETALPAKGYMGHILGYSLHFLLECLAKDAQPGALDESLPRILPIMEAQLFGEVAEEKEAGAFAGTREAKKLRAYDTYQLLAQTVTFRTQLAALLAPVKERLGEASTPGIRQKLSRLLQAALQGLQNNPTATPEDTLLFVNGVLETVIPAEEAAVKRAEAAAEAASRGEGADDAADVQEDTAERHQHLLLEFALGLLQRGLKKGQLGGRSPQMLAMLDPLLPLLVAALSSRHSAVVELALRAFSYLVQLPLPGLAEAAPGAGLGMTELLRRTPTTNTGVAQECLRMLAALMRTCPEWAPTTSQLRFLLSWAFADVEAAAAHVAAFTLLRAVIKRRLVLPEVYDLMANVQDLMIRAQASSVRQLCSSTLLQFLLDYPVGEKRLQQHMHFLISNLAYEHESGRLTSIDMIKTLAVKLPQQLLDTWGPVFFLPMVARLVNDNSAACRTAVGEAINALLEAATPNLVDSFATYCAQWLAGQDARLRRAAAQTLGLLADVEGARFARRVAPLLQHLATILAKHAVLGPVGGEEPLDGDYADAAFGSWQEAYYCLLLLTKIMKHCARELEWDRSKTARQLWQTVPGLLLYRHLWVRKLAADLLGLAFAYPSIWKGLMSTETGRPAVLAASFYQQLEATAAQDTSLAQSVKCLIFLSLHLYQADEAAGRLPTQRTVKRAKDEEEAEEGDDEEGEDNTDDEGAEHEREQGGGLSLYGLVRRMARLADDRTFPRQRARLTALRFPAALAARLGAQRATPFLPMLLRPLFRISEGATANSDEVKELAHEVIAHLREVAGPDVLLSAFNDARQAVTAARAERKRQQALQAMLDPAAAARSRIQKQARRAAGRKRRMEDVQRMRGAGVAVKNKKQKQKGRDGA